MPRAQKKAVPTFRLNDRVVIAHTSGMKGKVIELRGPLGPGGAAVYRVLLKRKPRMEYIEVLGDQLELVSDVAPGGVTEQSA